MSPLSPTEKILLLIIYILVGLIVLVIGLGIDAPPVKFLKQLALWALNTWILGVAVTGVVLITREIWTHHSSLIYEFLLGICVTIIVTSVRDIVRPRR